ncbi:unnamed protein product [Cyprideis torosa]|uniref:SCAP beta-propeller domain-containing protein n=1 Tax=Cyprideis torosa TaxID=163714 RepID=A0A7R8WJ45_9CRUS|nr:unnamed protein product [Cyprideis torosa]CAG0895526.1 unnamed protein product [Cyprideis torosa]
MAPYSFAVCIPRDETLGLLGLLSRTLQVPLNGTTVPPSLAERGASFTPPPLAAPAPDHDGNGEATPGQTSAEGLTPGLYQRLRHKDLLSWRRLPPSHFPTLFAIYNLSLSDRHLVVLPPIPLSIPIAPDVPLTVRHPKDKEISEGLMAKAGILSAGDSQDYLGESGWVDRRLAGLSGTIWVSLAGLTGDSQDYLGESGWETRRTIWVSLVGFTGDSQDYLVVFISYFTLVLYNCVCTRNYAEWRASWSEEAKGKDGDGQQVLMEAVPLRLLGHQQEVECIASDGRRVASVCLDGHLRVWDPLDGCCGSHIDRRSLLGYSRSEGPDEFTEGCQDEFSSDYGSGSSPARGSEAYWMQHRPHSVSCDLRLMDLPLTPLHPHPLPSPVTGFDFRPALMRYNPTVRPVPPIASLSTPLVNGGLVPPTPVPSPASATAFKEHRRNKSMGSTQGPIPELAVDLFSPPSPSSVGDEKDPPLVVPAVWCSAMQENLVVLGTSLGTVEVWDVQRQKLMCLLPPTFPNDGVTGVQLNGCHLIVARLSGWIQFCSLRYGRHPQGASSSSLLRQALNGGVACDVESPPAAGVLAGENLYSAASPRRRGHARSSSVGSSTWCSSSRVTSGDPLGARADADCISPTVQRSFQAHQQPISVLTCSGGRVLTGGQDHVIKVFRLEDGDSLFSFHGHFGPITTLLIDPLFPVMAASGSQDGMLCLWDLAIGTCLYHLQAHDGCVVSVALSSSYVVSLGTDEVLCVWERLQGHLMHSVPLDGGYSGPMLMITDALLVTSRQGSLIIWDVTVGEAVKIIRLGDADDCITVTNLVSVDHSVVCNYGNSLRVVRFPTILKLKSD